MINQGEVATFKGHFQKKTGDSWSTINNLSSYTIKAQIVNERRNYTLLFSTGDSTNTISVSGDAYSFNLTSAQTAKMLGDCTMEIALIDSENNVLITDVKATFVVRDSALGRTLAAA